MALIFGQQCHHNPPRLVFGEQLGGRSPAGFILEIDIRELLAGAVLHGKGRADILDSPRRREAASRGHKAGKF
jgi:hypothetical protein